MTKKFDIRDNKNIFNTVENPAVVFDSDTGSLYRIGEKTVMEHYFEVTQAAYRKAGFVKMADAVTLMDLPKDQDEIDKVFQITGYVKSMYEKAINA